MIAEFEKAEELGFTLVDPTLLKEAEENPRMISAERLDDLSNSLLREPEMMLARPIVVDAQRNDVVCGNMRLRASIALGYDKVPVYFKTFDSEGQRREWMLRDNNPYGDWVPDEVAQLVAEHVEQGFDAAMLGFSDDDIAAAVRRASGEALVPDPSEPPSPTLAAEVMIEVRCTKDAYNQIQETLTNWQEDIDGLELAVVTS